MLVERQYFSLSETFAAQVNGSIGHLTTQVEACVTASANLDLEKVVKALKDMTKKVSSVEDKLDTLQATVASISLPDSTTEVMTKEMCEKRADHAVRNLLPKHDLPGLQKFFDEDPYRHDALVRYLKKKLDMTTSKKFMDEAFRLVVGAELLSKLEWPPQL